MQRRIDTVESSLSPYSSTWKPTGRSWVRQRILCTGRCRCRADTPGRCPDYRPPNSYTLCDEHNTHKLTHKRRSACREKAAHTQLLSVGFWSWFRFLAVSLQVMWVINPAVGCHYFPPGPQLPSQPLRGLLPILLIGEQTHNKCKQFP